MNDISSYRPFYFDNISKAFLVSAVIFLTAFPARSQDPPPHTPFVVFRAPHDQDIPFPEGAGKPLVQRACQSCHAFSKVRVVNFDREDWDILVRDMVAWGAPLKKEEIPVVVDYLATNYKDDTSRHGVTVPGKVDVKITEWDIPTPHAYPHDSIYGKASGYVWITEDYAGALERFDPKTQQFKAFPLRPGTQPYTLAEDSEGNIFFTSFVKGFIGKFDPKTGSVKEYPLPIKVALHDIAVDQKGIVWFAVFGPHPPSFPDGSKIGRLDPKTGEVKLVDTPTQDRAGPYGLAINSKGVPFFTVQDSARLGSINPDTMKITEYPLPNQGSAGRRLTITPDDIVWFSDHRRGNLASFDPKTGKFREFPSPSGPKSFPYAITHVGNIIWYAESESKPNMMVRFDPKTEKFQSWPVKAGGGIKHLFPQPDGSLWFTRSLTNGIGHVVINEKSITQ